MADERRPELGTVTVGQTVIVSPADRKDDVRATVTKVGRVWIELEPEDGFVLAYYDCRFRMADQRTANRIGNSTYFYTEAQYAWEQRRNTVQRYLRESGITVEQYVRDRSPNTPSTPGPWHGREIELANLIRAHEGLDPL